MGQSCLAGFELLPLGFEGVRLGNPVLPAGKSRLGAILLGVAGSVEFVDKLRERLWADEGHVCESVAPKQLVLQCLG